MWLILREARLKDRFPLNYSLESKKKKPKQNQIGLFQRTTWAEHTTVISVLDIKDDSTSQLQNKVKNTFILLQ